MATSQNFKDSEGFETASEEILSILEEEGFEESSNDSLEESNPAYGSEYILERSAEDFESSADIVGVESSLRGPIVKYISDDISGDSREVMDVERSTPDSVIANCYADYNAYRFIENQFEETLPEDFADALEETKDLVENSSYSIYE